MKKTGIRKLVVCAMLSAVSMVLSFTPLGFIPLGPVSITILHLPVILAALLEGPVSGLVVGGVFGAFSLYRAFVAPSGPMDVFFMNPLVSILPRLLIGPVAWFVQKGLAKLFAKLRRGKVLTTMGASAVGSLMNTVGVLAMLYLIYAKEAAELFGISTQAAGWTIAGLAVTNGLPEAAVAAAILTPCVLALSRIQRR